MPIAKLKEVDLYYEIEGDKGPWIIFAHGGGDNHLVWWKQVAHLRQSYRCLVYDARWHGLSSHGTTLKEADEVAWRDLLELMDELEIERAFLNGHSMGGAAVSGVSIHHPERVVGAIMTCTALGFSTAAIQRWAAEMIDKIPRGFSITDRLLSRDFERREPALHYLYTAMRGMNPPRPVSRQSKAYLKSYKRMRDAPTESYADLSVPILFVMAEQDELQTPWLIEETAAAVRNAEVVRIANSGHGLHFERPEQYQAALDAFLEAHTA